VGGDDVADDLPFTVPTVETVPWAPPTANEFTQAFWDACKEQRLLVRRCHACGEASYPPRPACPRCWSDDVVWEDASGRGVLTTFSVVRANDMAAFRESLPYVPAIVQLAEGPRMMTTLVDSDPAAVVCDATVEVVFVHRADWSFPAFRVVP
jgi:uncharacterized protein